MTVSAFLSSVENTARNWLGKAANYLSGTSSYRRPVDQISRANNQASEDLANRDLESPCISCVEESNKTLIKNSIEKNWDLHSNNCSGFLRAVAQDFGITFDGEIANQQIATMSKEDGPWAYAGTDPKAAMALANQGYLVVAGQTGAEHGHVAIILPEEDGAHPGFPMASWGQLGSVGEKKGSIRRSFSPSSLTSGSVSFYAIQISPIQ